MSTMADALFRQRKFFLACVAMGTSIVGLFIGKLDGGTWVAAMSFVLGLYGAANVAEKKV